MKIAELIAGTTAAAFTLSILYLAGEGYALDFNLLGFFEPQDFAKSILGWLVYFLFFCALFLILGISIIDPNFEENKKKILKTSRHPKFSIFIRYGWLKVITGIFGIMAVLVTVLYLSKKMSFSILLCYVALFVVMLWYNLYSRFEKRPVVQMVKQYSILLMIVPPTMIITFVFGIYDGDKILTNKGQHSRVFIGNDSLGVSLEQIHLLNKYLIGYDTLKKKIKVIPTSEISSITYQIEMSNGDN